MRRPELKHLDVTTAGYVAGVTYAGNITALSAISQGVGGNQRVGDAVSVRGIEFRMAGYPQGTSTFLRLVLFQWNVPSSLGAPTAANVLQSVGVTAQTIAVPYDFAGAEEGRLNIIADEVVVVQTGATGPFSLMVRRNGQWQVDFDTGAVTASGQIYALVISDAALAGNAPVYQWWSRVLYDDL